MTLDTLAKRKRESLDTGIEDFNLKGHVFDRPLLPEELIHPELSNRACAIGVGIGSMIVAGHDAVYLYSEANRSPALVRPQYHVEVAAMEPEYNLARQRFERGALGADIPRSAESPLI